MRRNAYLFTYLASSKDESFKESYELQAVLYQKDRAVVPEKETGRKKSVLADLHQKKDLVAEIDFSVYEEDYDGEI